MGKRDPRVTAYIGRSAPFARPLLRHLRAVIHAGGGGGIEEAIKWGMPAFTYRDKIVCGLGAFKAHCALWFHEGKAVVGDKAGDAMGEFGRLTAVADLPAPAKLRGYVAQAMERIERRLGPVVRAAPATANTRRRR